MVVSLQKDIPNGDYEARLERFLANFHTKMTVFGIYFRDDRDKNLQALADLEIVGKYRETVIMGLEYRDYVQGPIGDMLNQMGEMWVFGKDVKDRKCILRLPWAGQVVTRSVSLFILPNFRLFILLKMTKIKSPFANCEATLMTETRQVRFRGEMFTCQHRFYRCDETGIDFTTSEQDDDSILQIYDQYRKKYGIPFPEELKATRKKYGLSAAKMSEVLGMGINQYRLYEDGEMPSLAVGKVLKSIEDPYIFKRFLDNSVNQFSKKDFEQMESKVAAVEA